MVTMGTVWDRTVDVLAGRAGIIARIALVTLFVPAVVQAALPLVLGAGGGGRAVTALVGLAFLALTVFGSLALTAIASDPAIGEGEAYRIGGAALPATLGALVLVGIVFLVLLLPALALLIHSGFDFDAAAAGVSQPGVSPGVLLGFVLYLLVFALVAIWAGARLLLLYPAIINERVGIGGIRRSFALTRGLTWRIVGVLILYLIVVTVAVAATQSVVGLVFRLALGSDRQALVLFLTSVVVSVVTTGFAVLQPVFAARLYAAVRGDAAPLA